MTDRLSPMTRGVLIRIESHLWKCAHCGSEPSNRGTIEKPRLVCPMHPDAEIERKNR